MLMALNRPRWARTGAQLVQCADAAPAKEPVSHATHMYALPPAYRPPTHAAQAELPLNAAKKPGLQRWHSSRPCAGGKDLIIHGLSYNPHTNPHINNTREA